MSKTFAIGLAVTVVAVGACGGAGERPNLVLITVDTLRADRLGSYGYERGTDPFVSRLAATGVRFEHAISQAPWTLPSIASLHTSLYPSQHGADGAERRLPDEARSLAEVLQDAGYTTIGVVSHEFVDRRHGLAQGFAVFDETNVLGHDAVTSEGLTDTALALVGDAGSPFFLWIHYFDPHFTYVRHPEFGFAEDYDGSLPGALTAGDLERRLRRRLDNGRPFAARDLRYVEAVYEEEIAHTDQWIGRLSEGLTSLGLEDRTVWIVTADHGEYFLERGRFFHGKDVYEELIHVPLVISGAIDETLRGVTVADSVEVRSIPATVMGLLGIEEHPFAGQDLLQIAGGTEGAAVFAEGSYAFGTDERTRAVVRGGWKLIENLDDGSYELYHLPSDPAETNERSDELSPARDSVAAALQRLLEQQATLPRLEPRALEMTPEELERLRALGYIR